ncbi:precorrin-3B C(17)-methyltransferase [Cyanobacterium sp. Dongsha4]|uniref:precorrin-3B C(17)-methyltransferase n=1 Tax=Cyanobacterium sp. DS4 TaxID=2878255 RepID=UPI002E823242|nr:precorrin-3B C(17)-methyltransferase [Cyanobacterium sp. Dongsha4]WVL00820.1 precorrin-3B C(17)-methyltransferase [Cyanobacterium sp. Dongsha4]
MKHIFADYYPLHFITTSPEKIEQLEYLKKVTQGFLWLPKKIHNQNLSANFYDSSLREHLVNIWSNSKCIVFCLTLGAVTRLIAPLLTNKKTDPAIIVIDPAFEYVICLTGEHQHQGDKLTELLAELLSAKAIITSASSNLNLPAIDSFGYTFGWEKGEGDWTKVSANITHNKPTLIKQESGLNWWYQNLPINHPFTFTKTEKKAQAMVYIGVNKAPKVDIPVVSWHPRGLWVGIGCERDTSPILIENAVNSILAQYNLARNAIASLATINLKADEVGILELAQKWQLPLKTFTSEELNLVDVPNPSSIVEHEVGTKSVAEASALKAASMSNLPENNSLPSLIAPKQIFKQEGLKGAVTVAIALSNLEYNPRQGKLYLIGTGPGAIEYLTTAAKTALRDAEIIIGYGLYIDLIKPLLHPSQIIETSNITQEKQRAERAISLSQWGLKVAVISSGDCGIYGMAGLVLEILANQNWDGKQTPVQVFSGITAMQSVAAKIGSPLMHDFCAISLSDLLTPWDVIEKRLHAAATGDFITAIYNPRSQTRQQQIITAQNIFLQYRSGNTPVAIARSVTREDESIILTTLEEMLNHPIDMLTTVLIGNSSTKRYHDLLITPRGYLGQS